MLRAGVPPSGVAAYDDIETGRGSQVSISESAIEACGGYGVQARGFGVHVGVSADTAVNKCKKGKALALQGASVDDVA